MHETLTTLSATLDDDGASVFRRVDSAQLLCPPLVDPPAPPRPPTPPEPLRPPSPPRLLDVPKFTNSPRDIPGDSQSTTDSYESSSIDDGDDDKLSTSPLYRQRASESHKASNHHGSPNVFTGAGGCIVLRIVHFSIPTQPLTQSLHPPIETIAMGQSCRVFPKKTEALKEDEEAYHFQFPRAPCKRWRFKFR